MDLIMAQKNPAGGSYAAWLVSNCDKTRGASIRWEFGKKLVEAGLRVEAEF